MWNNPQLDQSQLKSLLKQKTKIQDALDKYNAYYNRFVNLRELYALAAESDDLIEEVEFDIQKFLIEIENYRLECLMSGEHDSNDCFLEVHAGAGGTDAQDWASMLLRMYLGWCNKYGYKAEIVDEALGDGTCLKSAVVKITGNLAYGWLKHEQGVHRLVRISPFNANDKRQTSFAAVTVHPVIEDDINIVIEDKDLRIDTFRASGAGGQHVNKTDSAVRITHFPTGIVVQCQTDRSQHRNRADAMMMLKARLYEREQESRSAAAQSINDAKSEIGWGNHIRSYVLHPYKMVKDLRTGLEAPNPDKVLSGEINEFLQEMLNFVNI